VTFVCICSKIIPMSLDTSLASTIRTFESLKEIRTAIDRAGTLIVETLRAGRKLLICGNGGSLPAVALNADGSLVTCIANDYGFEFAFSRQIEGLAQPGDLVIGITSSGNSANIVAALRTAEKLGLKSIALLGRNGGKAKGLASVDLIVPGDSGRTAQEAHLFLIHHFCDLIDAAFD
jgi:D-sedoheptulose 7-phosphate isomerase